MSSTSVDVHESEELQPYELSDRYQRAAGRVHLTGIQALARVPIDQARRDRAARRRVGTYISGYEGSPLAGYDLELSRQRALLDEHDIMFEPGLNEEAAATAVQGSQLIHELDAQVEGVVGFWYGKSPGLDRATDALRHANLMGTDPHGGVVALVGDDPSAKSSSVPSGSEQALADLAMPTFFPADPGEILEMGRHAVALSRASGLWSALKIVTSVADGSASVDLTGDLGEDPLVPEGGGRHQPTARLLQPTLGPLERDFLTTRLRIVRDYVRLNSLNRVVRSAPGDRVGIIAAGSAFLNVQEALRRLGFGDDGVNSATVRLLKLDLVWPIHPEEIRAFAVGLDAIVVVEEKRAFIEPMVRDALYGGPHTPSVVGKSTVDGAELFPAYGELGIDAITSGLAMALANLADAPGIRHWQERRKADISPQRLHLPLLQRAPYYCSGCPHNTSTRPHSDSAVGAGIGCHAMVLLMDAKQVGDVVGLTQMGGEGTQWLGMAPFVGTRHFIQNLGDGTFHHSGSLAIRAAVASGRNITYRILYNSTVAMTGGQDAVGQMDVASMARALLAEGVQRVVVTSDDPRALRRAGLPRAVAIRDRADIGAVQRELASVPGTTVLIHEQECATELRRKRKRGLAPEPPEAVVINERMCEGCGDCGEKSNCLSVHPIETEFGRKTAIHQSSCNADLTCLTGDCPAFMTVRPSTATHQHSPLGALEGDDLPLPPATPPRPHRIRLMGVGGTGVATTSQVLATAAVLTGRHVRTLDQTGLAQKGGAVVADVTIDLVPIASGNKIGNNGCDLYLGLDLLVAADPKNIDVLATDAMAVVSTAVVPTGAMVSDPHVAYPEVDSTLHPIRRALAGGRVETLDARYYAEALFGAEQFANLFVVGVAHQLGALSLSAAAIEAAISLNGVAVDRNVQAFRRGRQFVADRPSLEAAVAAAQPARDDPTWPPSRIVQAEPGSPLELLVARRRCDLESYQDAGYARRYETLVEAVRSAEAQVLVGDQRFSEAVARYAYKLMAYKDEYEVARLALDPAVATAVEEAFGTGATVSWKLHPPILRALGLREKLSLGPWFRPIFRLLRALRRVRGTPFDVFGYAAVRRLERSLITQYETTVRRLLPVLHADMVDVAVQVAELPDIVRGYEGVKLRSVERYQAERLRLLTQLGLGDATWPDSFRPSQQG